MSKGSHNDLADQARSTIVVRQGDTYIIPVAAEGGPTGEAYRDLSHSSGRVIDQKYKIDSLLGIGGMGAVYHAHHILLNKSVALKTFRTSSLDTEAVLRFQREAQALAKLDHPNIVKVFDFGFSEEHLPYYTMELLNGKSLSDSQDDSLATGKDEFSTSEILELYIQIANGLGIAHSKGIVHRDIKPSNIFLQREGATCLPKLVDFGIACLTEQLLSSQKLTAVGLIFGSPLYMSPEQARGEAVTQSSDIYSLGCALFETLTGSPPYQGENAIATMLMHQRAAVPRLSEISNTAYPESLERMLHKMLAKNPDKRQQSVRQLIGDLQYVLSDLKSNRNRATGIPEPQPQVESAQTKIIKTGFVKPMAFGACAILLLSLSGLLLTNKSENTIAGDKKVAEASRRPLNPVSNVEVVDGKKWAVVRWRKKIGDFYDSPEGKSHYAEGVTRWEIDGLTRLTLDPEFCDNPDFVKALPKDSVQSLTVQASLGREKSQNLLKNLQETQNQLETLIVDSLKISDPDLSILRNMKKLHEIGISKSSVTGGAMAAFVKEKRSKFVEFQDGKDVSALLEGLKGAPFVEELCLDTPDPLSDQDYENIASLSALKSLSINLTSVKDKNLRTLSVLKNLAVLKMVNNSLTTKSAETLKLMASQHDLRVSMDDDSLAKRLRPQRIKGLTISTPGEFVEVAKEELNDFDKLDK